MSKIGTSVLFTSQQITDKVDEIARDLNKKFKNEKVIAIGVLKGAFVFYSQLVRRLTCQVVCDFCATSSYGKRKVPSNEVRLLLDTCLDISGQHVLLVEDIVDRGLALHFLQLIFKHRQPKSLTTAALVTKPDKIQYPCQIDYAAFHISSSAFIVGYGMDYQEQFRQLPYVAEIRSFN